MSAVARLPFFSGSLSGREENIDFQVCVPNRLEACSLQQNKSPLCAQACMLVFHQLVARGGMERRRMERCSRSARLSVTPSALPVHRPFGRATLGGATLLSLFRRSSTPTLHVRVAHC